MVKVKQPIVIAGKPAVYCENHAEYTKCRVLVFDTAVRRVTTGL